MSRIYISKFITEKVNKKIQIPFEFVFPILIVITMSLIYGLNSNIFEYYHDKTIISIFVLLAIIILITFLNLFNLYIFKRAETNYFIKEFICMKNYFKRKKPELKSK